MKHETPFDSMTAEEQVESLLPCANELLSSYGLGEYQLTSINHEFNSTFKVVSESGERFALRINVNSTRSLENLHAEIFFVNSLKSVLTPKPVANDSGSFVTMAWHEASGRILNAVLYTWLDGVEPGDEPTEEQLFALGAAMAKMHLETKGLKLPESAAMPDLMDFFWGERDFLMSADSELSSEEQSLVKAAKVRIEKALAELVESAEVQPIHADLHPWNVMWNEGELAVFDFDDSGLGLPVHDLATSLYYLDTPEQEEALLAGYMSVSALPEYTEHQMKLLRLQRRIILLSYLYETSHPEHREMIPKYQEETLRRIKAALAN
jgi:Ser/Thr protein kinase RdoA (MazF antagonist)